MPVSVEIKHYCSVLSKWEFSSKWELPCLPPSSLELWRREKASRQLSFWWKTFILIRNYGNTFLLKYRRVHVYFMEVIGYCSFCSVYTRVPKKGGREIGNHQLQYLLLFFPLPPPCYYLLTQVQCAQGATSLHWLLPVATVHWGNAADKQSEWEVVRTKTKIGFKTAEKSWVLKKGQGNIE